MVKLDLDIDRISIQKEELSEVKWIKSEELEKLINSKNKNFVQHDEEYKKLFAILRKRCK